MDEIQGNSVCEAGYPGHDNRGASEIAMRKHAGQTGSTEFLFPGTETDVIDTWTIILENHPSGIDRLPTSFVSRGST